MKYLYAIHIPVYHCDGKLLMVRQAALDLQAHQLLLPEHTVMMLAAPVLDLADADAAADSLEEIEGVELIPLKYVDSLREGLTAYYHNWHLLAKAVEAADFVHTGCGGFPFFLSPSYLAFRLALKKKKKVLFVMDCDLVGKLEVDQIALTKNPFKKALWYLYARLCWQLYKSCLAKASATFLLGRGVVSRYGPYANNQLEIYQPIVGQDMIIPTETLQQKLTSLPGKAAKKICFAGRLAPEKGLEVMFNALSILKDTSDFTVNIYGDGPELENYQVLVEELGIKDRITFHGNLRWGEELFSELRQNDIFIVPHLTLEMTRNVFDGMASGCAIIASDTWALARLMEDSQAGVVFATGDPEELADVLKGQLERPSKIIEKIKNGVQFVRRNDRNSHVRRRLDFLAQTHVVDF